MSPNTYARGTTVPVGRTIQEISETLLRFGCDEFAQGTTTSPPAAKIGFSKDNLHYRITMPLPRQDDPEFRTSHGGKRRLGAEDGRRKWEQATMERWRQLALYVKARIVGVEAGVESFEAAFLPWMQGPNGLTVAEVLVPEALAAAGAGRWPSFDVWADVKALPEGKDKR